MQVAFAYRGRSGVTQTNVGVAVALAPNLRRDRVSFVGTLRQPLRFREAMSALHDVVISDLRFKPRDKTAYEEWKKAERQRISSIRSQTYQQAKKEILARREEAVPPDLERKFSKCRSMYWDARQKYSSYLLKHDQQLWRML